MEEEEDRMLDSSRWGMMAMMNLGGEFDSRKIGRADFACLEGSVRWYDLIGERGRRIFLFT